MLPALTEELLKSMCSSIFWSAHSLRSACWFFGLLVYSHDICAHFWTDPLSRCSLNSLTWHQASRFCKTCWQKKFYPFQTLEKNTMNIRADWINFLSLLSPTSVNWWERRRRACCSFRDVSQWSSFRKLHSYVTGRWWLADMNVITPLLDGNLDPLMKENKK